METPIILGLYRGHIGIMEKKMETTIILGLYSSYIGIMEHKMDKSLKAVTGYAGFRHVHRTR